MFIGGLLADWFCFVGKFINGDIRNFGKYKYE